MAAGIVDAGDGGLKEAPPAEEARVSCYPNRGGDGVATPHAYEDTVNRGLSWIYTGPGFDSSLLVSIVPASANRRWIKPGRPSPIPQRTPE